MNMREKMAAKMAALDGYLNWHSLHDKRRYEEMVDAALDALMVNPGDAVINAGLDADFCENAPQVFTAMIRAIKEGK